MEEESYILTRDAVAVKAEDCEHCLFLGDLSAFCTEEILHKEFESFGNISSLQIARSKSNHKSLLYGFLTFEESISAVKALNSMNHKIICGRAINIRWANLSKDGSPLNKAEQQEQKTFCLKVSNVDTSCDEELFSSLFSSYEHLVSVQRKHFSFKNGQHLKYPKGVKVPYVLVWYSNASSAAKAMRELDGKVFGKTVLQIQWATNAATSKKHDQEEKKLKLAEKLAKQSVSIYITFVGMTADIQVTEEMLRDVFGSYGPINDVAIRLTLTDTITHVQKGYAFVYYEASPAGIEGALQAQHDFVVDKEVQHVFYHVELSKRLKSRLGMNHNDHDDHGGGKDSSIGENSERSDEQKVDDCSYSPKPRASSVPRASLASFSRVNNNHSTVGSYQQYVQSSTGRGKRYRAPHNNTLHRSSQMVKEGGGGGSGIGTNMVMSAGTGGNIPRGTAVPVLYFATTTGSYHPQPVMHPRLSAYTNYPPFYAATTPTIPFPPPPLQHYSSSPSSLGPQAADVQHHLVHPTMTPFYAGPSTVSYPSIPYTAAPSPSFLTLVSSHYPNYPTNPSSSPSSSPNLSPSRSPSPYDRLCSNLCNDALLPTSDFNHNNSRPYVNTPFSSQSRHHRTF